MCLRLKIYKEMKLNGVVVLSKNPEANMKKINIENFSLIVEGKVAEYKKIQNGEKNELLII